MKLFSENIFTPFFIDTLPRKLYNINVNKIRKLVNIMTDKKLLETIQNDIKNLDKCIEMCIDDDGIEYLKTIQQDLRDQETEIVKRMAFQKVLKEQQPIFQKALRSNNMNKTPSHYQGTIQPIDLINAQNINFNLGNVVKYVCRAGKKKGENVLSDLEKAKNYINYEIERVKK